LTTTGAFRPKGVQEPHLDGVSELDRLRLSSVPTFDYDKPQPIMVQFLDLREK